MTLHRFPKTASVAYVAAVMARRGLRLKSNARGYLVAVGVLLLGGCATTDRGQAIEGQAADIGSTLAVAASYGVSPVAVEGNPIFGGSPVVMAAGAVLKLSAPVLIDRSDMSAGDKKAALEAARDVGWGATGWNIAIGLGAAHPVALVAGLGSYLWSSRDRPLPDRAWDDDPTCDLADCWSLDLWPSEIAQLEALEWERYQ